MAKSLRAKSIKTNKSNLRRKVFAGPDRARTERLSAKLAVIVQRPRDTPQDTPPVNERDRSGISGRDRLQSPAATAGSSDATAANAIQPDMDIDGQDHGVTFDLPRPSKKKMTQRRSTKRPRGSLVFPSLQRSRAHVRKRKQGAAADSVGKSR